MEVITTDELHSGLAVELGQHPGLLFLVAIQDVGNHGVVVIQCGNHAVEFVLDGLPLRLQARDECSDLRVVGLQVDLLGAQAADVDVDLGL